MTHSDFVRSHIVRITKREKGTGEQDNNLQPYDIEFLREIYECPDCGSVSFSRKRSSECHVLAIMDDEPSDCKLIRTEYNCNNPECPRKKKKPKCFYNTHGHEDRYFKGEKCMKSFVLETLKRWLKEKTYSLEDIRKEYGISKGSAVAWSLSLRKEFDSHFEVPTQSIMVFCSFEDRDGAMRGVVGSPAAGDAFRLLSFIDEYTPDGLEAFFCRIKKHSDKERTIPVSRIYYDGPVTVGSKLEEQFNVTAISSDEVDFNDIGLGKAKEVLHNIVERVKENDSYDTIVLKFLYDNSLCRTNILKALNSTAEKHGIKPLYEDINKMGYVVGLVNNTYYSDNQQQINSIIEQLEELPTISDYYAVY